MTFEITINDVDFKTVSEYAAKNKISLSELFLNTVLEKIHGETLSDENLLKMSNAIIDKRAKVYEELAK